MSGRRGPRDPGLWRMAEQIHALLSAGCYMSKKARVAGIRKHYRWLRRQLSELGLTGKNITKKPQGPHVKIFVVETDEGIHLCIEPHHAQEATL